MNREVQVGSHTYQIGKLSAFQAYDVARRYATVFLTLNIMKTGDDAPAAQGEPQPKEPGPEEFARALTSLSRPIPQADIDFAIRTCLSVVSRKEANGVGWAPVQASNGKLMFEDIEMMDMLVLLYHVMKVHKIPDFFAATPSSLGLGILA